jgi:carboxymethylenebutenolidase
MGAAAALAGCASGVSSTGNTGDLRERMVEITTRDGVADAFFVHPAKGSHPGVIMWPDIAGLREAKKVMARRLAAAGYAVLCVNQYYRGGPAPVMESFAEFRTPEGQAKIKPLREALTTEAITRDGAAYVGFLDGDAAVDKARKIGSNGYCMGGPFTVRTAAAVPARVGAAASFHGAGLVTPAPDSPHRLLARTQASYLFAVARNDDAKDPASKEELRKAADAAGRTAEIEVYPADHGWCVPDSPVYDPVEADKAWSRMLALFGKL